MLVVLLDLAPMDGRPPEEQERILLDELGRYRPDLLTRPRIVVGAKADVAQFTYDGPCISAVTHQGLDPIVGRIGELVDRARADEPVPESYVVHRPVEEGFAVERDPDGAFRLRGRAAERVVAMADLTNVEAIEYVHIRFRKMGVEKALARAGAREGDIVRVAGLEFEYVEAM